MNPYESELRRLTVIKALVRKEINTTKNLKKKEVYRKKYEQISSELEEHLKYLNIEMN